MTIEREKISHTERGSHLNILIKCPQTRDNQRQRILPTANGNDNCMLWRKMMLGGVHTQCTHQATIHSTQLTNKSNLFQPLVTHRFRGVHFFSLSNSVCVCRSLSHCNYLIIVIRVQIAESV